MSKLLDTWRWIARTANVAHLRATDSLSWRNFALGGLAAVLGALVSLSVFGALQDRHVDLGVRIGAIVTALAAGGSAALWKYLNYGSRVEAHHEASRAYGNLVREIDQALQPRPTQITNATVTTIRMKMDEIDNKSPNVSPAIWTWAVSSVAREKIEKIDPTTLERGAWSRLKRLKERLLE